MSISENVAGPIREEFGGELVVVLQFESQPPDETKMSFAYSSDPQNKRWVRIALGLEEGISTLFPALVEVVSRP